MKKNNDRSFQGCSLHGIYFVTVYIHAHINYSKKHTLKNINVYAYIKLFSIQDCFQIIRIGHTVHHATHKIKTYASTVLI